MVVFKNNTKIPKRISPCPVKEAIVEFRFFDNIAIEILSGLIYNSLAIPDFSTKLPERLAINDIPISIRTQDQNLKYQPHYSISVENDLDVKIGLNNISILNFNEYIGWGGFLGKVNKIFEIIDNLKLIRSIDRVGLRYISFFETSVSLFENLDGKFEIFGNNILKNTSYINTNWQHEESIRCMLQITNSATLKDQQGVQKVGSMIDIDVSNEYNHVDIKTGISVLDKYHEIEKQIFFNLLNPKFLEKFFNPEY